MGEAVEIILDFLRRNHFTDAEAAFKAELLTREGGGRPLSSSENFLDWDLQSRLPGAIAVTATAAESGHPTTFLPDRNPRRDSSFEEEEAEEMLFDNPRSPPEKQLYVEYESRNLEHVGSSGSPALEFAFEYDRTSSEPEIAVSIAGPYASSASQEPLQNGNPFLEQLDFACRNLACVGGGVNLLEKKRASLSDTVGGGFREYLPQESWTRQIVIQPTEQPFAQYSKAMQEQQYVKHGATSDLFAGFPSSQLQSHQHIKQTQQHTVLDWMCNEPELPSSAAFSTNERSEFVRDILHGNCSSIENQVNAPGLHISSANEPADEGIQKVEESAEEIAGSVGNELLSSSVHDPSFKDPALKNFLPFSFLKSSESDQANDQHRVVTPAAVHLNDANRPRRIHTERVRIQDSGSTLPENGGLLCSDSVENLESRSLKGLCGGPEELPRLPPVKLHSIDNKKIDFMKEDECAAENSTRSSELAALPSTPEGNSGWAAAMDAPPAHDTSSSGLWRPFSRVSVSHGIVEDTSDHLLGFGDGQSEKESHDDYCDSDTYEDEDDPGYHRQPIEDEEWFLAHEIDYPTDDERARHCTGNDSLAEAGKLDEDDRSFVEEESYFSGEEYYRLQAVKEGTYRSQQSELIKQRDQAQPPCSLKSLHNDNGLLTFPRGNDEDNGDGQALGTEEFNTVMPEPVWKGFISRSKDPEQDNGFYDENHGSVRSGGVLVSSDAADVGSEVRESLVGGSSEGDLESLRDQEMAAYRPAHGTYFLEDIFSEKAGRHVQVKSAPVRHLDEEEEHEGDLILKYYTKAWGHSKGTNERGTDDQGTFKNELIKTDSNKEMQGSGGFLFEGFSFPSPSSTGDIAVSRAGSGKSLWSNRDSVAQEEETDGYGSGIVGPDDTLAVWKHKSNQPPLFFGPSKVNLPNLNSAVSVNFTDERASLVVREDGIEKPDAGQLQEPYQLLAQRDEDAVAGAAEEEITRLGVDEDQYEIFDLRVIHRRNRTGFEEEKDFPVVINSVIAGRYHVREFLGCAAFSKAIQAHDLLTGIDVCMKIIKNNKDFFDQSLDEIKLLKFVNKHDPADNYHILRLYDYFYHREHLFIVCELLRANLYEFHKFNRESGGEVYFTMPRLQSITRQCLEALEYLHRLGIIHCDLKPENILVKSYSQCEIKIIDLGSSCFQTDHLCPYVQSRSYRAPEVILGLPYNEKIDIWSLGCILAEMCSGHVLFQNDSLATLLARVVGILGPIDPEVLAKGRETHKYFTKNYMLYERNQETDQLEYLLPKKACLRHRLPMGDQGFIEFVEYLLQNNPAKRPSATEALTHPWLSFPYEPISS